MQKQKFDEIVSYFNKKVSEMEIETKYKMELLGMVAALGCAHEKETHDKRTETHACDLISRRAAIDVVAKWFRQIDLNPDICIDSIISLPSAQPNACENTCEIERKSNDMISREDALSCFRDWIDSHGDVHTADEMPEYQRIEQLQSAQPDLSEYSDNLWRNAYERGKRDARSERKPGKWKKMTAEGMLGAWWYECSVCGVRPLRMRWTNMDELSNYCPNCGARMVKEGEEHD